MCGELGCVHVEREYKLPFTMHVQRKNEWRDEVACVHVERIE